MSKDKTKLVNYLISTIRDADLSTFPIDNSEYLSVVSSIICQFDTDVAISVMNGLIDSFGEDAKNQELSVKINYGY